MAFVFFLFECCLTHTETRQTVRDGEPRTTTSTFTQLLSSDLAYLKMLLNHKAYWGRGAQDGHLDFHYTAPELC